MRTIDVVDETASRTNVKLMKRRGTGQVWLPVRCTWASPWSPCRSLTMESWSSGAQCYKTFSGCYTVWPDWTKICRLGYFFPWPIFTYTNTSNIWFVVGILRFQKLLEVDVSGFQIQVWCWYFEFFFGHFSNKVGKILFNFLVTVFVDVPNRITFVPCKPLQLSLMIVS
jgi:hypothetical protein